MTKTSRTFEVSENFRRMQGSQNANGSMLRYVKEAREKGLRFVLENIAKDGSTAVYIDHATRVKIPFTEDELEDLQARFIIIERFSKVKKEE